MTIRNLGSNRTDIVGRLSHNFPSWDRDKDGKVEQNEFRDLIADPEIKGRDAAALATLYTIADEEKRDRKLKNLPSVSNRDLDRLRDEYFKSDDANWLDRYYEHFSKKLDHMSTELFQTGLPNSMSSAQGGTPTCAFLSVLFTQAHRDPESVKRMVEELDDGTLSVQFPGDGEPIVLAPPTETEQALYSTAKDGVWLTALEKAWSVKLEEQRYPNRRKSRPYEDNAASTVQATYSLTGADKVTRTKMPKSCPSFEKGQTPRYMAAISDSLAKDAIVTASCLKGENVLEGIADWHAYSVTSWNEDKGTVGLRNPWGSGEPENKDGKARDGRDDGRFDLSLEEFLQNFRYVTREER